MARQGYTLEQGALYVCEPLYHIAMPCGSDPSPEGVYNHRVQYWLTPYWLGGGGPYPQAAAEMLAYADAYPHICTGEYLEYEVDVCETVYDVVEVGTKEEIVWTDLDGDGIEDIDEWEVITVVDKEIVEKLECKKEDRLIPYVIPLTYKYCGYTASHYDTSIPECGGGYKVIREWRAVNWCTGEIKAMRNMNQGTQGGMNGTGDVEGTVFDGQTGFECYSNYGDGSSFNRGIGDGNATQRILVRDNTAPKVEFPTDALAANLLPWVCESAVQLPGAKISDNCPGDLTHWYTVWGAGSVSADGVFSGAIPDGAFSVVTLHVEDECGNVGSADIKITGGDNTPPVPVCEDELVVSLTPDLGLIDGGIAKIPASAFDAGSHDAGCGPVAKIKVIRMEDYDAEIDALGQAYGTYWAGLPVTCAPEVDLVEIKEAADKFGNPGDKEEVYFAVWSDYVKFCCADDEELVIMRVWDAAGNYNDCMVRVTVQNKIPVSWTCPDDVEVTCLTYSETEDYGSPYTAGLCQDYTVDYIDVPAINSCGEGLVKRIWTLVETGQIICEQKIYVSGVEIFDPYTIQWPIHYTEDVYEGINKEINPATDKCEVSGYTDVAMNGPLSCEDEVPKCEPTWTGVACGLVGVSYEDETVYFDDEACIKIIRRWTVVDWCTWEPNDGSENFDDENDTERDQFVVCEDWCEEYGCHARDGGSVYFRYTEVDWDGYYTFDQIFKVVDTEGPTLADCEDQMFAADGADCTGSFSVTKTAEENGACASEYIRWTVYVLDADGAMVADPKYATKPSGEAMSAQGEDLAPGTYTVRWVAADGCGNEAKCDEEIMIADKKAPTPYCIQSISTAVMAGDEPMVEIWASDYDLGAEDNCSAHEDLLFSFSGDEYVPNMTFTCDDVTGGNIELQVWVWDEAGNRDYCYVEIRIDDNGHCAGGNDGDNGDGDGNDGDGNDGDGNDGDGNDGDGNDGNDGDDDGCEAVGGVLKTDVTDLTEITICVGDGMSDAFDAKIWENVGESSWIITDNDGNILQLSAGPPVDFEAAGLGICRLYHLSSFGRLDGVAVGANISDVDGCHEFSNPIVVTRVDSGEACESGLIALVQGNVSTELGDEVENAEVMFNNDVMPEYPAMKMTSFTGNFAFVENPVNYDYKLTASKEDSYMNGVSTLDLVLIQQHILGITQLDSPYKVIAADANADQKVSGTDLVELRKLILGIDNELSNVDSWVFVDKAQTFNSTNIPWPYMDQIEISNLSKDMYGEDFVGVKVGDVNGNAAANSAMSTEVRSSGTLKLNIADAQLSANEIVEVKVTADNFSEVYGYQFTMNHAGLSIVGVASGALDVSMDNIGVNDNMLTMSWNNTEGVSTSDVLFTLEFRANEDVQLANSISLNDRITLVEAYTGRELAINDIELNFTNESPTIETAEYRLLQNTPNPFNANTNISFVLPANASATLSIFDVTGKLVSTVNGDYTKGLNTINLTKSDIGAAGVLYYQIESGEFTATKKMVVIE